MKYEDMTHKELRHVIGKRDRAIVYLHKRLSDSQFEVSQYIKANARLKLTASVVILINLMAIILVVATHVFS